MAKKGRLFVVVPTFKETNLVRSFLNSWQQVTCIDCVLLVCNGNPGDETGKLIADCGTIYTHKVIEVPGSPDRYWSGLVSLGLQIVQQEKESHDYLMLTNIDVTFDGDPIVPMLEALSEYPKSQIAGISKTTDGRLLTAGVSVCSWALSLNKHICQGMNISDLNEIKLLEVTYLPTRFVIFPVSVLDNDSLPNMHRLPHYCADFEYTNRLRIYGYKPFVHTGVIVNNFDKNTGFKTFQQETSFLQRISKCLDIKCSYNLKHRFWFVWMTYPGVCKIPGMLTHFAKIFLEILVGGHRLK